MLKYDVEIHSGNSPLPSGNIIWINDVSQDELEYLTCILRSHDVHFSAAPYAVYDETDEEESEE